PGSQPFIGSMKSTQLPWLQMAPKAPASSRVTSSTLSPPSCCRTDHWPVSVGAPSGSVARASLPATITTPTTIASPMHRARSREGRMVWDMHGSSGGGTYPFVQWMCLRAASARRRRRPGTDVRRRRVDARHGWVRVHAMVLRVVAEPGVHGVDGDQQEVDEKLFCRHEDSGRFAYRPERAAGCRWFPRITQCLCPQDRSSRPRNG